MILKSAQRDPPLRQIAMHAELFMVAHHLSFNSPQFFSKVALKCSAYPVFYFLGRPIKFLRLPIAILARINDPIDRAISGSVAWINLKITIGAERSKVFEAAAAAFWPPPENSKDALLLRKINDVLGQSCEYPDNKRHSECGQSAKREENNEPIWYGSCGCEPFKCESNNAGDPLPHRWPTTGDQKVRQATDAANNAGLG